MRKRSLILLLTAAFVLSVVLGACGRKAPAKEESEATTEEFEVEEEIDEKVDEEEMIGAEYGYAGTDPVEAAIYKYMVEETAEDYDKADVSIPTVTIIAEDYTDDDEVVVYGDFWIENYDIDGDTLKCVSGGNYPGVMHLTRGGEEYSVSKFDVVADGGDFDQSAKELFGEYYQDFMDANGDEEGRNELRKQTVSDYVKLNGLSVTQYQDEGSDPVELDK